jgi:hypothetical protein
MKELLRLLIAECGFPADHVWFARQSDPSYAVDDPIEAIKHDHGPIYKLLLVAEVGRDDGTASYFAHVVLYIAFESENITLGTSERVGMVLHPVPVGGPNSGMADLVSLVRETIRNQIVEYGTIGSLTTGIL